MVIKAGGTPIRGRVSHARTVPVVLSHFRRESAVFPKCRVWSSTPRRSQLSLGDRWNEAQITSPLARCSGSLVDNTWEVGHEGRSLPQAQCGGRGDHEQACLEVSRDRHPLLYHFRGNEMALTVALNYPGSQQGAESKHG